jgi:hypothetical protein
MRPRALIALLAIAAAPFAGDAAAHDTARAPAYTTNAGFRTALQNVPENERREECLDLACHEKGGTLVSQGTSVHDGVTLTVRIREYRHHRDQTAAELEAIAKKMLAKGVDDRELRLVAGKAGDRPALEQWSIVNPCEHEVGGRVLVSLSDKVVEVFAAARTKADASDAPKAVWLITSALYGVRIRRVGDVPIDPAADPPPASEIADALMKSCQ